MLVSGLQPTPALALWLGEDSQQTPIVAPLPSAFPQLQLPPGTSFSILIRVSSHMPLSCLTRAALTHLVSLPPLRPCCSLKAQLGSADKSQVHWPSSFLNDQSYLVTTPQLPLKGPELPCDNIPMTYISSVHS